MEIKPCLYCKSKKVTTEINVISFHQKVFDWFVFCVNCGARGPIENTEEKAIETWNQRPYDFDMPAIVKKVQQLEEKEKRLEHLEALINEANNCSMDGEICPADWDNILLFVV